MSDVVHCPGKTCTLEMIETTTCFHYLPTPNASCQIPCDLSGCRHEITHGLCPFWSCEDMPIVTTLAPPLPPPEPPAPATDQSVYLYLLTAALGAFFVVIVVLAIFLFLKRRAYSDLDRYTTELRRFAGIEDAMNENSPIIRANQEEAGRDVPIPPGRNNSNVGRNYQNINQNTANDRLNPNPNYHACCQQPCSRPEAIVPPRNVTSTQEEQGSDFMNITRAPDSCFSIADSPSSGQPLFERCPPQQAQIKNPLLEEDSYDSKVKKVQRHYENMK